LADILAITLVENRRSGEEEAGEEVSRMMEVEGWRTRRDFVVKKEEEEEKKKARLHDILQAPAAPAAPAAAVAAMAMVSPSVEHSFC